MKLPLVLLTLAALQSTLAASPQRPTLLPGQSNWTPSLEDGPLATSDMSANSAQSLVDFLTAPGVVTANASFQGATVAGGVFNGGLAAFGIDSGVVLSSGNVATIAGPQNQVDLASTFNNTPGLPGTGTNDAAILEFTVQSPTADVISLQFIFASEEYSEFANRGINDAFLCLVNGVNYAKVPGTNSPISIDNVNCGCSTECFVGPTSGVNCQYFIENDCDELGLPFPCSNFPTEMDGFTTLLTMTAPIAAGSNSIQLSVADGVDFIGDSVVLLREGSLMLGTPVPEFTQSTPCGQVLSVREGELLEFGVSAVARNGQVNQDVRIDLVSPPGALSGATFDPPLGTPGQPAVTQVSWTPSAADVGLQLVRFRATDQLGVTSDCEFQILVEPTPPFVPCEERLAASSEQALDRQGTQVDYSDGRSILGSPERSGAGMVTIHEEIDSVWTEVADIPHPAPSGTNDVFGWSVAIDGDWAVVGAPFEGTAQAFNGPGATYVFRRDANGTWALWQQLLRSGTQTQDDRFGFSVDVTGDFLAVGAFGDSQGGANNGAVYVYRLVNGSTWVFEDKLLATPLQNQQTIRLGTGVAIDGGTVISGAPYEDINGLQSAGAAYVFERQTNSTWVQSARLTTPTLASGTFFGVTVDAFGSRVIVGAEGVGGVGAAFIHERALGGGWGLEGTLTPQVPSQNLTFGQGVRLYGGRAAVNARNASVQGQPVAGAVEIFELDASLNWTYVRTLAKTMPAAFDAFGAGIGLGDGGRNRWLPRRRRLRPHRRWRGLPVRPGHRRLQLERHGGLLRPGPRHEPGLQREPGARRVRPRGGPGRLQRQRRPRLLRDPVRKRLGLQRQRHPRQL